MATIIPAKDVGKYLAKVIEEALKEMPDDRTRQAVLDAFSKQMFYGSGLKKVNEK